MEVKSLQLQTSPPRRLRHFTPLRYPGGKGKLAPYIKALLKENKLLDGEYVEPYAGGSAIAMELLFHEYVSRVHINDLSRPVYAFWSSVLHHADDLCRLVNDTPLTIRSWDKQRKVFANQKDYDDLALGFATLFLNRTNRSGILNAGIIGGRDQTGSWKIDARYNRDDLTHRIEAIAKMESRISLTQMDALDFIKAKMESWPDKTLIYIDPPYYEKGRHLYYDFYQPDDHEKVKKFVARELSRKRWVVSYDNVAPIRALYKGYRQITYKIGYSARDVRQGTEVMFFSDSLQVNALIGPFKLIRGAKGRQERQSTTRH